MNWSYTSVTIYCHVIKRAIWLYLRSGLIGSSGIRTRDLSVLSLTRCHLSYRASVYVALMIVMAYKVHTIQITVMRLLFKISNQVIRF